MPVNLRGRSFVKLLDYSPKEINYLLDLSRDLKRAKYSGTERQTMKGKNVALIFEKASTRTRCAFEVGAMDQGAGVTYLGPTGTQMGVKETVKDTARVLGGMYDGIEYRGFSQESVETLAEFSGVPVWNGLTDEFHPTQILADWMTIQEKKGYLKGIKFAYVGDGRNNMANSLMIGAAKMGMDFRIVSPESLFPEQDLVDNAKEIAKETGAKISVTDSVDDGVGGVDVIYTDVWVSMGEAKEVWEERIKLLKPYQVNKEMMSKADDEAIFMHCLPSFHNTQTDVGKDIYEKFDLDAMEVTDEVFESKQSVVFEEAENRMHTIKAVMVATLGD
ncbi:MAG: ornithine carbamoyltransferase [Senegalia sp. (in: firmicutes)]|uniref:ornithine carbamoyltransferase n=1 Tax=Senegalia sp. (in: firmicutes) TaxID=1924098 RepID=UPI003F9C8AA7